MWLVDSTVFLIPLPDLIIACCALDIGATIVTTDPHFSRVPGLRVLDALPVHLFSADRSPA